MKKSLKYIFLYIICFIGIVDVQALTGIVNVNDSLTLRDKPSTSGAYKTSFYNNTELTILDTNAGSGNGCPNNWYKVSYGGYTGYSCGTYITLNNTAVQATSLSDDSYVKSNYDTKASLDGSIMCYEDTGDLSLRSTPGGSRTGAYVSCGTNVTIHDTSEGSGTCPYYYQITANGNKGWVCGYFVNTTKLSKTAQNYYNTKENLNNYYNSLREKGFPESYLTYLAEIHARHTNWDFTAEKINLNFEDVINGESIYGRNLLEGSAFNRGYYSMDSNTYDILSDSVFEYPTERGWYNASKEAIAYYMDPRNYLNDKYIFAFESLQFNSSHDTDTISKILSGQTFWPSVYRNYSSNVSTDIINATRDVGISSVHVASRIKQEISGISTSDARLGGSFTYNNQNYSGYYNFFNINVYGNNKILNGMIYALNHGWNTPYNGIHGGASFIYNDYVGVNQDTMYYEKFDVSTSNGHYDHQYMQNLSVVPQETTSTYKSYVNLGNYIGKNMSFTIPVYNNMSNYAVSAPKNGNPNNYLKAIKVNGNLVNGFSYNTYHYNVYLQSSVTSVNISADTINGKAKVSGVGNIPITSNDQNQEVVVTSENGKKRTYYIHFVREVVQKVEDKKDDSLEQQVPQKDTKQDDNVVQDNANSGTQQDTPAIVKANVTDIMNHSGFKYNGDYLFGIGVGTNVSRLIGNVTSYNKYTSIIIKSSNGINKTNDSFKTGDVITITGSDGSKTFSALIYGDINGDGVINKDDCLSVLRQINGYTKLSGAFEKAADANKDGKIDKDDCLAILREINGYTNLND